MRFCYLASGSRGNCLCIWHEQYGLLIDCGLSATQIARRMRMRDIDPVWFHALLLGQAHGDHTRGLEGWHKRHPTTTIYATRKTAAASVSRLAIYFPIALRETRTIGPFTVTTVPVWHDNIAGAAVDDGTGAVTFIVEHNGKKLALLYESGRIMFDMFTAAQGARALFIEANYDVQMIAAGPYSAGLIERVSAAHLSNQQAAEYLTTLGPETQIVMAVHRSAKNNDPELVRSTLQAALDSAGSKANLVLASQETPTEVYEI